jgi:hypothetical protein
MPVQAFPVRRTASDRSLITPVIVGAAVLLGVVAVLDAFRSSNGQVVSSTSTTEGRESGPTTVLRRIERASEGRLSRTVGEVRFSLALRTVGWEAFERISINKSASGPQDAEAIIFWASFPEGDQAQPCDNLASLPVDTPGAALADAVASAPGTELLHGPLDVTLDGRPAKHVAVSVREKVGCKPGFFYSWDDVEQGALWPVTRVGDTIRVWIVDIGDTRLFIEAETSADSDPQLEREVVSIVKSIRFS